MTAISPPARLGILGGGQLGRYFVQAAQKLGYQVWVLDPDPDSPAGRIADRHLAMAYDDRAALDTLAAHCAAITTEFENVPAPSLEYLARTVRVAPAAAAVAICQDRIAEKAFLRQHGLPHGPYAVIRSADDVAAADSALFPGILKVARFGYDGKGQSRVSNRNEALAAFHASGDKACVLEALLPLDTEVSVVLARGESGETACFPVAENSHRHGILDVSIVPARIPEALAGSARQCALQIAEAMGYVGTLAVEFFVSRGRLFVNEMAPRPHNSGHYTLDACETSQYAQQLRALCGLPLADPAAGSAAVMVNLLGELWFDAGRLREPDWPGLQAIPGLRLHLYGKSEARPGRKMGHFTVVGKDLPETLATAMRARRFIGNWDDSDTGLA
ncbi:MAG: 5-(carboxyamino)imidazole ribonucleotide synthase [Gammaproteobacteria bacterium]|jgi:5-(carboxyamino)imidazole ribonucleotide synthase|nr:5-(carboxyamino)imidazole ribonucleotide synthase [Gammaproteobacteria bacterium]